MLKQKLYRLLLASLCMLSSLNTSAALQVLACEPEWTSLLNQLADDRITIKTATTAQQDPHHIEARPSLIAGARNADLLVCTGAELEEGWLPILLRQASNSKIQAGQNGQFFASDYVSLIDKPSKLDRSAGDIHAAGNPHVHLDPRNIPPIARALTARLSLLDPNNAPYYTSRLQDFLTRWQAALVKWEKLAAPLRGIAIVEHHQSLRYLGAWLGFNTVAALEPKPGIDPSSGHLTTLLLQLQKQPARLIVRTPHNNPRAAEWLSERSRLPIAVLPYTVGGSAKAQDLFGLFDECLQQLLQALNTNK